MSDAPSAVQALKPSCHKPNSLGVYKKIDAIRDKDSQSAKDTLRSLLLTLSDKRRETPLQFARGSENNDTLTAYNYRFMYNGSVLADIADILKKQILILDDSED
mgnify:CR=1